jgi:hypothetical protein
LKDAFRACSVLGGADNEGAMQSICDLRAVRVFIIALTSILAALSWLAPQARSQPLPSKEYLARDNNLLGLTLDDGV